MAETTAGTGKGNDKDKKKKKRSWWREMQESAAPINA